MAALDAMAPQLLSPGTVVLGVAGTSWHSGFDLLGDIVKAVTLDSSSASTQHIVTSIAEQLEQSGRR
jgi:hypothetical protein